MSQCLIITVMTMVLVLILFDLCCLSMLCNVYVQ